MRIWPVGVVVVLAAVCGIQRQVAAQTQQTGPAENRRAATQAHAHNDYLHQRPLQDALEAGFASVEADVFLVDGQLLVAHTAQEITPNRTLRALYLDPLRQRISAQGGQVYPATAGQGQPLWLLIDIKSDALATYRQLHTLLAEYADILSSVEGDNVDRRAVQVVISGNRPQEFIAAQPKRYCGIDGRLSDLDSERPAHLLPMISDNWSLNFTWRGHGPMPQSELERLRDIVDQAHARGRVVRFWATPETEELWRVLRDANVDFINTDELERLSRFLRKPKA